MASRCGVTPSVMQGTGLTLVRRPPGFEVSLLLNEHPGGVEGGEAVKDDGKTDFSLSVLHGYTAEKQYVGVDEQRVDLADDGLVDRAAVDEGVDPSHQQQPGKEACDDGCDVEEAFAQEAVGEEEGKSCDGESGKGV